MAWKSNHQKHRELNLRGRSIARIEELEEQNENPMNNRDIGGFANPGDPKEAPSENSHSKMKNINEIVGITALHVETEDEQEDELHSDVAGDVVQSMGQENRGKTISSKTMEQEGQEDTLLQLEKEDVHEELEY
ncbi:hypothetical protein vseg_000860 [Gypsophila vaccaria]